MKELSNQNNMADWKKFRYEELRTLIQIGVYHKIHWLSQAFIRQFKLARKKIQDSAETESTYKNEQLN